MTSDTLPADLPVARVTCLEDRAQVERRGRATLEKGRQRLLVRGLSPLAVDRSLKVEIAGATPVEVRLNRQFIPRPPGDLPPDASALRRRVDELEREVQRAEVAQSCAGARVRVVDEAHQDLLRDVAESAGAGRADPKAWEARLARTREAAVAARDASRAAASELRRLRTALQEARAALERAERPDAVLEATLEILADVREPGEREVKAVYLVPCAAWRPSYRATLSRADGKASVVVESRATVWQRTGEDWSDVELELSTARPTLGSAPPQLAEDRLTLRDKAAEEKKAIEVAVREEEIQTTGEGGAAPKTDELPGVDDGGETRTLRAPGRASIPSDGLPYRVDLLRFTAPAEVAWTCAPELSPLVSLVARFENTGPDVLLAGPMDLVRDSGIVGRGLVKFAARGERIKLSFGSEDALRVARHVEEERSEAALTGRKTVQRKVKLFVSNAGGEPAKLLVEERVPVSEVSAVEVKLLPEKGQPAPAGPDADGLVRFDLALAAREHRELSFAYQLSASSSVQGI